MTCSTRINDTRTSFAPGASSTVEAAVAWTSTLFCTSYAQALPTNTRMARQ